MDGSGWQRITVDGSGWQRITVDGSGWQRITVDKREFWKTRANSYSACPYPDAAAAAYVNSPGSGLRAQRAAATLELRFV